MEERQSRLSNMDWKRFRPYLCVRLIPQNSMFSNFCHVLNASSIINNLVWHDKQLSYDEIKNIAQRYDERILEWVDAAYNSSEISMLDLDETYSIGYTLRTLPAALWCYWHSKSFEDGLLSVVNEGGDADTNGAIACAILGAKFGYSSITPYYINNLHRQAEYHKVVTSFISEVNHE